MKNYQYNIFKTQWGWFGLLGCKNGLLRTCLPTAEKEAVKKRLLKDIPDAKMSKSEFSALETRIQDYYKSTPVDFSNTIICLDEFTEFQQNVLMALRKVKYGKVINYKELAQLTESPQAARAVGSVMAANPLPLIIPCHRVIKADGIIGNFSGFGGIRTKKRMLELEKS